MIDGTPCSYDHPSNMCVQGKCIQVGCDRILNSPLSEDKCGICAGDGSKCSTHSRTLKKRLGRELTKFYVIPKGVRNVEVLETLTNNVSLLIMRERRSGITFFDGSSFKGIQWNTVAEGAKFQFDQIKDKLSAKAKGPILGPIILGLKSNNRVERELKLTYVTESLEDTHSNRHRQVWIKVENSLSF